METTIKSAQKTELTIIDLISMHNDVKQCFRGSNVHCGSSKENEVFIFSWGVAVTNESTWRRISPKREI